MTREPTPGGPWICTFLGHAFFPLDPRAEEVHLEDLAQGLSHKCRFNGMTREFYSVAEHSVRVANLLKSWGEPKEIQIAGLLHDGSEAYLPDVPRPVKMAPGFREVWRPIEDRVQVCVNQRFNLPDDAHDHPKVKLADNVLLATEKRDLMNADRYTWAGLPDPLPTTLVPFPPEAARIRFLFLARELLA